MTHAQLRARERYGLEVSLADLAQLVGAIEQGGAVLVGKTRKGGEVWRVEAPPSAGAVELFAVYVPDRSWPDWRRIVTFLPLSDHWVLLHRQLSCEGPHTRRGWRGRGSVARRAEAARARSALLVTG